MFISRNSSCLNTATRGIHEVLAAGGADRDEMQRCEWGPRSIGDLSKNVRLIDPTNILVLPEESQVVDSVSG
jgi:hypothetical protein